MSSAAMMARAETGPMPDTEIKLRKELFFRLLNENRKVDEHLRERLDAHRFVLLG